MRYRIQHFSDFKREGTKFACLTSYDMLTAGIFDRAGIPLLLVGDSAADNVLGYDSTAPVTIEELIPFARAVRKGAKDAFVVVDMPFGSYEVSPEQAVTSALQLIKSSSADAVKLEGGITRVEQIRAIVAAGIPVMGHVGFTPQTVTAKGGYRVQGRSDSEANLIMADARAVQDAGAFSVVLELIPSAIAAEITKALAIPTIGIGAGSETDGQILVWTDFAGMRGKVPRFVKKYLELESALSTAATDYRDEVAKGVFPGSNHGYE